MFSLSDETRKKVNRLIDAMQSNLVELYDIMNELRSHLGGIPLSDEENSAIFSEVKAKKGTAQPYDPVTKPAASESKQPSSDHAKTESSFSESVESESEKAVGETNLNEARVSRVLDPIAFEVENANSPAEVVAEYVQSAKDELITPQKPNNKVSQDMDIVLKFLRARGTKPINPDERENILRRIKRWHAYLVSS
ncbi:hypothetical protein EU537_01120 [Candidatus Thorarchaeota archaeon]|nr:MAG: hypothetical protein EU537_01120 [Candidatus Thorarchaeota archaeon]